MFHPVHIYPIVMWLIVPQRCIVWAVLQEVVEQVDSNCFTTSRPKFESMRWQRNLRERQVGSFKIMTYPLLEVRVCPPYHVVRSKRRRLQLCWICLIHEWKLSSKRKEISWYEQLITNFITIKTKWYLNWVFAYLNLNCSIIEETGELTKMSNRLSHLELILICRSKICTAEICILWQILHLSFGFLTERSLWDFFSVVTKDTEFGSTTQNKRPQYTEKPLLIVELVFTTD